MVLGIVRHISSLSLTCFSRQGTVRCVLACRASIPHSPRQLCRTMLHAYGCIRSELTTLIDDEGENVVVAMHSCGGIVGTEAVDAAWNKQSRQAKGQPGGVLRLLYLCAFVLPPNASLASGFGGQIPPLIETQVSVWKHCILSRSSCCNGGVWQHAFDLHKINRLYLCTSLTHGSKALCLCGVQIKSS